MRVLRVLYRYYTATLLGVFTFCVITGITLYPWVSDDFASEKDKWTIRLIFTLIYILFNMGAFKASKELFK